MDKTINLRECSIHDEVKILGHKFHGLEEIKSAVELSAASYGGAEIKTDFVTLNKPKAPIPGIHVIEIWEPYPCFDAEDRLNENRTYQNYFLSKKQVTPEQLSEIYKRCHEQFNFSLINKNMPAEFTPAVYYVGDRGKMVIATSSKSPFISKLLRLIPFLSKRR
jgi:hypothetical protein